MAATCATQIPEQSALAPLSRPFVHYDELTGIWQSWDMFTTTPYYHGYGAYAVVTDRDGQSLNAGVLLPGLLPYDHSVRNETFFLRVVGDPSFAGYLDAYAANMCRALRAKTGSGGQKIVFHESCERLRWLNEIRENGALSNHEDHATKTFTCE